MGITVFVKHYVTEVGMKFVSEDWFPAVSTIIRQQPGFVYIAGKKGFEKSDCFCIELQFENAAALDTWVRSPLHEKFIQQLNHFKDCRSRDYWVWARYEGNEYMDCTPKTGGFFNIV